MAVAYPNWYDVLELTPAFALDEAELQARYDAAQRDVLAAQKEAQSEPERAASIQRLLDIDDAYEGLKDPVTRAEHLLELQGINAEQGMQEVFGATEALVTEMQELREHLSACHSEADAARAVQDIRRAMTEAGDQLADHFAEAAYQHAAQQTQRLRYLGKALEEAMMVQYKHASHSDGHS